ncbi:DinB family protein [Pedobacter gandavensis]|uniref:DinB family protein n=1 Tax=Pedobacter gandavensis TaxID=2679963 RepID=A0ABR6F178_9SPHI|nr:DinB family protein [Pedobacter gandavensis]MBB2151264.1 DinB family protein [Pedobacter gandavensis]
MKNSLQLERLIYLCDTIPSLLTELSETELSYKPLPDKWSKKEILGHLIDSATCNHQRFVRAQFETLPTIVYDQNNWNAFSHYQLMDCKQLILFWSTYNRHLVELIHFIDLENLEKRCLTGGGEQHTIAWLFNDYVTHLEYHLRQILKY